MKIENMVNCIPNNPNQTKEIAMVLLQDLFCFFGKKPFTTFQVLNDECGTQSANNLALPVMRTGLSEDSNTHYYPTATPG